MINTENPTLFDLEIMISRPKSRLDKQSSNKPLRGHIVQFDPNHKEGKSPRTLLVEFTDGTRSWWQPWELSFNFAGTRNANYSTSLYNPTHSADYNMSHIVNLIGLNLTNAQVSTILHAAQTHLHEEAAWTDFGITQKENIMICKIIGDILDATMCTDTS